MLKNNVLQDGYLHAETGELLTSASLMLTAQT